jgi:hypothetical protein
MPSAVRIVIIEGWTVRETEIDVTSTHSESIGYVLAAPQGGLLGFSG